MSRKQWLIVPCSLLALFLLLILGKSPISFGNLDEAKEEIATAGFHCTSDRKDGKIVGGFLVTRELVDWVDVNELPRPGRAGPQWDGKAWVTTVYGLKPIQAGLGEPSVRVWGKVVAFGDDAFLDEIEGALRPIGRCL